MNVYEEFLDGMPGQTERDGQRQAVNLLIELSLDDPGSYSISAPTGTGKSYAALLAGVYNARDGKRTVIGTSTVVLSEQYKDEISRIEKVFPDVEFAVLKGASNYYCGNKAGAEMSKAKAARKVELKSQLANYARGLLPAPPIWARCDTDYCAGCVEKFKRIGTTDCQYAKARMDALEADVVVTTHAMISVNMNMDDAILGKVWLTIFDEAHKASASLIYDEVFGASRVRKLDWNAVLLAMPLGRRSDFVTHFEDLKSEPYADEWKWFVPSAKSVEETTRIWPTRVEILDMRRRLKGCPEQEKFELGKSIEFIEKARGVLDQISSGSIDGGLALWMRGGSYKMQDMIPDAKVVEKLKARRVAWLSATIGTHSRPTYSLDKCGLKTEHFSLDTPFDYSEQLQWTVRTGGGISETDLIAGVNGYWPGGCVVLTGSHKRKERITENLRMKCPEILVQEQTLSGNAGNQTAIMQHCDVADAGGSPILVGVEIFSTGIDLPGPRLTKLVLAGLFPLRDDAAYTNWRKRWLESFDGDGFEDYELPERAIALEQQIGRVIRRVSDKGVIVFYVNDGDWTSGSKGRKIIEEALCRFKGAVEI